MWSTTQSARGWQRMQRIGHGLAPGCQAKAPGPQSWRSPTKCRNSLAHSGTVPCRCRADRADIVSGWSDENTAGDTVPTLIRREASVLDDRDGAHWCGRRIDPLDREHANLESVRRQSIQV